MDSLVRLVNHVASVVGLCFVTTGLAAQVTSVPNASSPPNIIASAVGETRITPDRATLSLAVETQGGSAAAAASDNARLQARVIDAVKVAGVAAPQIRTSGYNVSPEYSGGKTVKVTGYRAHNTLQIEIRNIDAIGKVIDAALGAGATNIGRLSLYSSSTDTARRDALAKAVTKARAEAQAAASAAGGSLGQLVELAIEPYGLPRPYEQVAVTGAMMSSAREGAPTPVETGELVIQAAVRARWQFVPR